MLLSMIPFTLDTNNKKGIFEKNGQFLKNDRLGDKRFPRQNQELRDFEIESGTPR